MPPIPPNFTAFDWRYLAHGCHESAEREQTRAAELAGAGRQAAARGFEISAELFERLEQRRLEMTRPR